MSHALTRTQTTVSPQSWLVDRVDDLVARRLLLERRDGVLEVEEHHVGAEAGRLAEHLLAGAGHREARAAGQVARAFGHAGKGSRCRACRTRRSLLAWPTVTLHELADGVYVWLQPGGESGVEQRGRGRRRRRHHRDRHADGALAVGAVRRRGRTSSDRPVRRARAHARAHRPRRRHARRSRTAAVLGSPQTSDAARRRDAARRVQGVHARVRRGVRRPRRARHPPGHPPRRPTPRSSRRASRCSRRPATPRAT